MKKNTAWEESAHIVENDYGGFVDWEERFFICPDCEEPIYECDWSERELSEVLCPVCGFLGGDLFGDFS